MHKEQLTLNFINQTRLKFPGRFNVMVAISVHGFRLWEMNRNRLAPPAFFLAAHTWKPAPASKPLVVEECQLKNLDQVAARHYDRDPREDMKSHKQAMHWPKEHKEMYFRALAGILLHRRLGSSMAILPESAAFCTIGVLENLVVGDFSHAALYAFSGTR